MPIAFLNRFEKQLISYRTSLPSETEPWISKIEDRLTQMFGVAPKQLAKLFCGFDNDTIPSALFNILAEKKKEEQKWFNVVNLEILEKPEFDEAIENAVVTLFKPLCNPEIILEIAIDQGAKFEYEKAAQKEFPYFGRVIELQQMEPNKQMALILTGDFECNLPDQWNGAAKKIASFKKSSDFEQTINHFFSSDNTTQDLLILQYVHGSKNFSHFMHIKHTLEHAHYQYYCDKKEEKEKEVRQRSAVLLVHIKPPIFKNPFPLIFSRKWKFTYVDSLSSTEPAQLKTLLSQTMCDVLGKDVSNSRLHNSIRRAFARLQFPVNKNGGNAIQQLSTLFKESIATEKCRKGIVSRLKQLFKEGVVSKSIACILNNIQVKNPSNVDVLSLGCCFLERYENIIDRLLTIGCMNILSVFYENCYFQIFFNAVEKNCEHLSRLFVEVMQDTSMVTIPCLTNVMQRLVSIEPDLRAVSIQYEAMFPWSHVLHNWCHSKLAGAVTQLLAQKSNLIVHENEDVKENERENENKYEYENQHGNGNDNENGNKIRLESHRKVLQSSNLLKVMMDGENALKYLNMCNAEHCRMYFVDIIAAKYNLKQHKAEIVAKVMFAMIYILNSEASIAMIESILHFLPDIFATYVKLLKLCQDGSGIVLELHTLLNNENESTRLSSSIRLLLKHFISFSSGLPLHFLFLFFSNLTFFLCALLENEWSDIIRSLEAVESVIPTIIQFAKDWYDNCKEYNAILAMCRQVQMQILGAKHFGRQMISQEKLNTALSSVMSLSENGWLNDKNTIPDILKCMLKGGNLALDKRPHFVRDVLTTVQNIEELDTPNKKRVYHSVITDIFHNASELTQSVQHATDKIRLQILEELVLNQWNDDTFGLDTYKATLLNRVLERIYINTPNVEYNGPNQSIANISNVKTKLFQCINSILSITKTLKISEMKDNQKLNAVMHQTSQLLIYFDQFNKCYQHSLHIWFLKQFCIAKGMDWTQMFFTNAEIRARYPIFVDPQMSDVFSVFKYRPSDLPCTDPFIGIYGDKYIDFRNKCLRGIN
ncbi:hypothetical protein RFI_00721 [Reticulomyxa filosa]|uniref:Uncharacterized protein n=1 Tax=Reticulomyxa filosa TaxID=46433 RepID=X6PE64_RETFI|nr:hypothetical protein RFI_00721 [Reticulomyxa filosa]|eukprot:ETO36344.1 hypothetical protein RFI_00721 [Reticulomyxa filosa]